MNNNEIIVTPLGTVSPYCKYNKNCPGFMIESNGKKILFDCGNGISRLLKMPDDLRNLIIIISHLHKDHYMDLGCIAYASYVYKNLGYLKNKIKVYIPSDNACVSEKNNFDYNYLMNFGRENYCCFIPYDVNSKIYHGDMEVDFACNPHPLVTYSARIKCNNGLIVYSSDTGYSNNKLVPFGNNADLLICESSFLKEQYKKSDSHLYAYEAALIAKNANVKQLMLTHFWPEIDGDEYVREAKEIFDNTIKAEEGKKLVLKK